MQLGNIEFIPRNIPPLGDNKRIISLKVFDPNQNKRKIEESEIQSNKN